MITLLAQGFGTLIGKSSIWWDLNLGMKSAKIREKRNSIMLAFWRSSQKFWRRRVKNSALSQSKIWWNLGHLGQSLVLSECGRSGKLWRSVGSTWRSLGSNSSSRYLPEVLPGSFTLPVGEVLSIVATLQKILFVFSWRYTYSPFLPKCNLTLKGWLTDRSSPFPIANLTLSDP